MTRATLSGSRFGLGFRVQGLRVQGSGFRVGLGVQGFGLRHPSRNQVIIRTAVMRRAFRYAVDAIGPAG